MTQHADGCVAEVADFAVRERPAGPPRAGAPLDLFRAGWHGASGGFGSRFTVKIGSPVSSQRELVLFKSAMVVPARKMPLNDGSMFSTPPSVVPQIGSSAYPDWN